MNYIQALAEQIKAEVSDGQSAYDSQTDSIFCMYVVLLLAKGQAVTAEDVHNAWAAWKTDINPSHPSLKPFDELTSHEQKRDEPFVVAIKSVASKVGL